MKIWAEKSSTGAEIEEIEVAAKRVIGIKMKDGGRRPFDVVVSNADVARTYLDLLKREPLASAGRRKVSRSSYSMSLFVLYFGTKKQYPDIAHHSVLFGARYKELLDDIFRKGELAEDFSLYLHAPSRTDPSLAPEGGEAFYVLSPVPHLGKSYIDWKTMGPKYADKILQYLEERYLPGLRQEIVTQRIFTPEDFKSELNAHLGSAFSIEPLLHQSAYFRVANRDPKIGGLYFAGAGTHPGAGIPGVVNSAKATCHVLLDDLATGRLGALQKTPPPLPLTEARTPAVEAALTHCRDMITVGSKSFSLASKLFTPEIRDAAFFLYGWCRFCDDQIDQTMNLRLQDERLQALKVGTELAFENNPPNQPVFVALAHIAQKYRIPSHYALELIEGMAMDVRKERYWTLDDLTLYCYRVAGTVGLMMSHAMGVSSDKALRHAADLGIAMQLTNIARDVLDDAAMGRVYLPLGWLDEAGVPENQLAHPRYREGVALVVKRMLEAAHTYYKSGNQGLKYLPWRSAFAVAVANQVYSEIGRQVMLRGVHAWDSRTVVTKPQKAFAVVRGFFQVVRSIPYRILRPWRLQSIRMIWRHA